jgi:hypothetical protein
LYFSNYLAVRYRVTGACVVPNPEFVPSDTIRQTYLYRISTVLQHLSSCLAINGGVWSAFIDGRNRP